MMILIMNIKGKVLANFSDKIEGSFHKDFTLK